MHTEYLSPVVNANKRHDAVLEAAKRLNAIEFDCIAVRGVSGLGFGAALAFHMSKDLIIVRKGERCHSDYAVEAPVSTSVLKYIIVDDLTCSGETINEICLRVPQDKFAYVGLYLFSGEGSILYPATMYSEAFHEMYRMGPMLSPHGPMIPFLTSKALNGWTYVMPDGTVLTLTKEETERLACRDALHSERGEIPQTFLANPTRGVKLATLT